MNGAAPIAPGAGAALVTLFASDGALLLDETAELARRLVEAGCASILVSGTVGEFYALDDGERVSLFEAVRRAVPQPVPVIAHVGGVPADRVAQLAAGASSSGADALLAL